MKNHLMYSWNMYYRFDKGRKDMKYRVRDVLGFEIKEAEDSFYICGIMCR